MNGFTNRALLEEIPNYDPEDLGNQRVLESRQYQDDTVQHTLDAIEEGHKTILLVAPTGSGKSSMGARIGRALQEQRGYSIGWTAMRHHLLVQAAREHHELLNCRDIGYWSTFTKHTPNPKPDVWIEDEGHHAAAVTSTTLTSRVGPKIHIAMTATDHRNDRMKLCFSKVIKDSSTHALVQQGYLSQFKQFIAPCTWAPDEVAELYLKDVDRWGRSLVFFPTLDKCWAFALQLRAQGCTCEVVSAASDQENQLADFRNGDVDVLVNVSILTEGFDEPALKTVFIRPSGNKPATTQMGGRVLRKHADKPFAQVVQNIETRVPFTKIAPALDKLELHNGKWISQQATTQQMNLARLNLMLAAAKLPDPDVPPLIAQARKEKLRSARQYAYRR